MCQAAGFRVLALVLANEPGPPYPIFAGIPRNMPNSEERVMNIRISVHEFIKLVVLKDMGY